ncbi:MAG: ketoacyl-ACP synthase III [Synergistaceae bacterium]|jgi:3-oxoacyl-[acyl-carrier-protein] synthase-3|nr:ketoacyl-ACP synthase III [Synergistaceae bacterium]
MRLCSVDGVSIGGVGACVPEYEVDNLSFGAELFGKDIDGAVKTTGVRTRRVCPPGSGITALDMAVRAAEALFGACTVRPSDVGGVIFVTQTPDYSMPNNASQAANLLGLSNDCAAFDASIACPGYVYGLWLGGLTARSMSAPVLLLNGETHSASPRDRSTVLLFGDAGTATLILPAGKAGDAGDAGDAGEKRWLFGFWTDGSKYDALMVPEGGARHPFNEHSLEYRGTPESGVRRPVDIAMDGMAVFDFAVRNTPRCMASLMEAGGVSVGDVDVLLLHQANLYMMKQIAKRLGFPPEKMPVSLDRYGNSSSATIPVTICSELNGRLDAPLRVLAAGFGAGMAIGVGLFNLGPCACTSVVEYR